MHNPAFTFAMLKAAIEEMGGTVAVEYEEGTTPQYLSIGTELSKSI